MNHKEIETDARILLNSLENERTKIAEAIIELDERLKKLSDNNFIAQSLPTQITSELKDIIPKIAAELDVINTEKLNRINDCYAVNLEQQNGAIERMESRFTKLTQDLDMIDKKRIKRFFLGVSVSVIISVVSALAAASYMMQTFPTRVVINNPANIILHDSEVSLWGTDNVKVLKDGKKKN